MRAVARPSGRALSRPFERRLESAADSVYAQLFSESKLNQKTNACKA
jgi:hypothetical protein